MTATDLCANTSEKMKANVNSTTPASSSSTRVHTHRGTHCKSPTEWTNRIPFKPNIHWNQQTHMTAWFLAAESLPTAQTGQWWIRALVSHILLRFWIFFFFHFRHVEKYTWCAVMTTNRWRQKGCKKRLKILLSDEDSCYTALFITML